MTDDPELELRFQALKGDLLSLIEAAKQTHRTIMIPPQHSAKFPTDQEGRLVVPPYCPGFNYAEEFWRQYVSNELNCALLKTETPKVMQMEDTLARIRGVKEEEEEVWRRLTRKKKRRMANEITKSHECPYERCYHVYGSEVSLNLHIKLKHGGGNKSEREQLVVEKEIVEAEEQGLPMPRMRVNLPEGMVEKLRVGRHERRMAGKQNVEG